MGLWNLDRLGRTHVSVAHSAQSTVPPSRRLTSTANVTDVSVQRKDRICKAVVRRRPDGSPVPARGHTAIVVYCWGRSAEGIQSRRTNGGG